MRVAVLLAAGLLLATPAASALGLLATAPAEKGEIILGYREGSLDTVLRLVTSLGGEVLATNKDIRYVVASTGDVTGALATAVLSPGVEYAERNDRTGVHGAQWNGAQWNGVDWNGAQWNGVDWNGAQWNGAQWNSGPAFTEPDPGRVAQWGLERVRAPDAWNVTQGERRASLCVLDTGVDPTHPDLAANVGQGFNAIAPHLLPLDDAGHGTHIAGIAAAAIGNGFGTAGVANVRVLPVKVLDAQGTGKEDDLAAGIVWCAKQGASVAVMALGVDDEGPTLKRAIAFAHAKDVLLLASAGNAGCDKCVNFPARHKDVIAVGATDASNKPASFSSRGPQVELAAPGAEIVSTFPEASFRSGSGTSQAVAFAAGAAALLRDDEPGLSAAEARARLVASAKDLGPAGRDEATGHGMVDVHAALG